MGVEGAVRVSHRLSNLLSQSGMKDKFYLYHIGYVLHYESQEFVVKIACISVAIYLGHSWNQAKYFDNSIC